MPIAFVYSRVPEQVLILPKSDGMDRIKVDSRSTVVEIAWSVLVSCSNVIVPRAVEFLVTHEAPHNREIRLHRYGLLRKSMAVSFLGYR